MDDRYRKNRILTLLLTILLLLPLGEVSAGIKPMVVKVFEELVHALGHSSSSPRYPNLAIQTVKAMPDGRIGIAIVHQPAPGRRPAGRSDFTVPFDTFYRRTTITLYRFDHSKQRFALWERHSLRQLDPMKRAIPAFYQKPGSNFSFVSEHKFQGTDGFGVVLESPQPESRYDDNSKLVQLTSPTHRRARRQADLAITSVRLKNSGSYCYPVVEIRNLGGRISDKAWRRHGATIALYFRDKPTEAWKPFLETTFSALDPQRRLQPGGGGITYVADRAIERSHQFKVMVDAGNNIPESNESNNQRELYLTCNLRALPLPGTRILKHPGHSGADRDLRPPTTRITRPPREIPKRVPRY